MKKGWRLMAASAATLVLAGMTFAQAPRLDSTTPKTFGPLNGNAEGTEVLFRGDMTPETGLGCSGTAGTSGGPNDYAVGVTATATAPPFQVVNMSYNVFTGSPNITALSFVAWAGGAVPGAEIGRVAGLPTPVGNQSTAFTAGSAVTVNSAAFYFGLNQPQSNAGYRLGLDQTTSAGTSFIRAPVCGAVAFATVDSLGFAGNWVMAATIDVLVPVELEAFDID